MPGKQVDAYAIVGPPNELSNDAEWQKASNIQISF